MLSAAWEPHAGEFASLIRNRTYKPLDRTSFDPPNIGNRKVRAKDLDVRLMSKCISS